MDVSCNLDKKYREYISLLERDPMNSAYIHKTRKYHKLLKRSNDLELQKKNLSAINNNNNQSLNYGGASSKLNHKTNMADTRLDNTPMTSSNTADIIDKINEMISYIKENQQMKGGHNSKDNLYTKTPSQLHHKMKGGNRGIQKTLELRNRLLDHNDWILDGMHNLKNSLRDNNELLDYKDNEIMELEHYKANECGTKDCKREESQIDTLFKTAKELRDSYKAHIDNDGKHIEELKSLTKGRYNNAK